MLASAIEVLFCTAILRLLASPYCIGALLQRLRDFLEEEASSAAEMDTAEAASVTKHFISHRFFMPTVCAPMGGLTRETHHQLHLPRGINCSDSEVVLEMFARILGLLSQHNMHTTTARWLPKLNRDVTSGRYKEAAATVYHLRYVNLGVYTEQQLRFSVDFLEKLAQVLEFARQVELKHELCALLTACMERMPTPWKTELAYSDWDATVSRLYRTVEAWAAKAKHTVPAYRALAALLSVFIYSGNSKQSVRYGPGLIDTLLKYCRDKTTRGAMLIAFQRVVSATVRSTLPGKASKSLLPKIKQGLKQLVVDSFCDDKTRAETGETLGFLVDIAVLLGSRDIALGPHSTDGLDFVMEQLVAPALSWPQGESDETCRILFGLRAFLQVCRSYEDEMFTQKPSEPRVAVHQPSPQMEPRLLRHARKMASLIPALLSRCVTELDRQSISASADAAPNDRYAGVVMVTADLLKSIPLLCPGHGYSALQKIILKLSVHPDATICEEACAALIRLLHMWPPLRSTIVTSHEYQGALFQFCSTRINHLAVARVLANRSVSELIVRIRALELLESSHQFQNAENRMGARHLLSTLGILEQTRIDPTLGLGAPLTESTRSSDGTADGNAQDQLRWSRLLGVICNQLSRLRPKVATLLRQAVIREVSSLIPKPGISDGKPNTRVVHAFRNCATASCNLTPALVSGEWEEGILTILQDKNKEWRAAAVFVLGQASPEAFANLSPQLHQLINLSMSQEVQKPRARKARDELRKSLMFSYRLFSERLTSCHPAQFQKNKKLRDHLIFFMTAQLKYIASSSASRLCQDSERLDLAEVESLRVDFCYYTKHIAVSAFQPQIGCSLLAGDLRRRLFALLSGYCGHTKQGQSAKTRENQDMVALVNRFAKEDKDKRSAHQHIRAFQSRITTVAAEAMAYIFWGEAFANGCVYSLARYFMAQQLVFAPMQDALETYLLANCESIHSYIDRCYGEVDAQHCLPFLKAIVSFVSAGRSPSQPESSSLWLLALYQMSHADWRVRRISVTLLQFLDKALCQASADGTSQESELRSIVERENQNFALDNSVILSRELSCRRRDTTAYMIRLCYERLGNLDSGGQTRMTGLLVPWVCNLDLSDYRSSQSPRSSDDALRPTASPLPSALKPVDLTSAGQLLECLFKITQMMSDRNHSTVRSMWINVASNATNVEAIVNFVIDTVMSTYECDPSGQVFLLVGKTITTYICEVGTCTIDKLAQEINAARLHGTSLQRSSVAIMLAVEVIPSIQKQRNFITFMPLLLHCSVLGLPSSDTQFADHCCRLLLNLIRAAVVQNLSNDPRATLYYIEKLRYLSGSKNAQTVCRQEKEAAVAGEGSVPFSELQWIVQGARVACGKAILQKWSILAVNWGLLDQHEQSVARSYQVFRFLAQASADGTSPELEFSMKIEHVAPLIFATRAYVQAGSDGVQHLLEAVTTIQHLLEAATNDILILFPQVFWLSQALMASQRTLVFQSGVLLFKTIVERCSGALVANPGRRSIQAGLAAAELWPCPFAGAIGPIIKGLGNPDVWELCLDTLGACCGVEPKVTMANDFLFGAGLSRPVTLLTCQLPGLCESLHMSSITNCQLPEAALETARGLARLCRHWKGNNSKLEMIMLDYPKLNRTKFLERLRKPLCDAVAGPPTMYAALYGPLLALLQSVSLMTPRGEHPRRRFAAQILAILHAILCHSRQTFDKAGADSDIMPRLVGAVSSFLEDPELSTAALKVLNLAVVVAQQHAPAEHDAPGRLMVSVHESGPKPAGDIWSSTPDLTSSTVVMPVQHADEALACLAAVCESLPNLDASLWLFEPVAIPKTRYAPSD